MSAVGLELQERGETSRIFALENLVRFHVKLLQLARRQVDSPTQRIFTDVAQDIGELEGQPELVGVGGGLGLGLTENLRRDFADDAGHQMAIALQSSKVQVARLFQVDLAAFDDGQQVPCLNAVV